MVLLCRLRLFRPGLFVTLLALAGQWAWGATIASPGLAALGAAAICHGDHTSRVPGRTQRHIPPGMVSVQYLAMAMPIPDLPAPPALPPPPAPIAQASILAVPHAGPVRPAARAAQPRGPPIPA